MQDRQLECSDCHKSFVFSGQDQEFHKMKGYNDPKRCKSCRAKKRADNANQRGGN